MNAIERVKTSLAAWAAQGILGLVSGQGDSEAAWAGMVAGSIHGLSLFFFGPSIFSSPLGRAVGRGGVGLLLGGAAALAGAAAWGHFPGAWHIFLAALAGAGVARWDLARERRASSPFSQKICFDVPRPHRRESDLVIVGGGFAGLACAARAASAGLRVVVLDRKPEPGVQVRTTGIYTREAAALSPLPPALTRAIGGVRLYAPSLRFIDLDRGGDSFFATDTAGVLRWMAGQAEAAGAQLMWGRDYRGAQRRGTQFRVTGETLSAPFLVGADGVFSRVSRDFGLGRNRRFLYGAEVELEGVRDLDATRLHCFLTREFAPGYIGWAVPGVGATQIGLAGRAPFRPRLEEFLTRLRRVFNLDRARALSHRHGWIPAGGPVSPARAPGVLLIGDAAGHVSPLTAGGIRLALERGASVADEIADQIQGRPHPAPPPPSFAIKRILREALEHAFPDAAAEALLTSLLFRQTALRLLFG